MIYLKEANIEDYKKEYNVIRKIPHNENGFINSYQNVQEEEFKNVILPELINKSNGINVSKTWVPETYYFLWEDEKIIGLYKIRHYLNDFLVTGSGHIGFGILNEYRGKGYATKGLSLAVDICKNLIREDEIYLSANKDNKASIAVQKANGALIVNEDDKNYYLRIKIR